MSRAFPGLAHKKSIFSKAYAYMFRVRNMCRHPGAVRIGWDDFRKIVGKVKFFQWLDPLMFRARNMFCHKWHTPLRVRAALPRPARAAAGRPSPVCAILPPCPVP